MKGETSFLLGRGGVGSTLYGYGAYDRVVVPLGDNRDGGIALLLTAILRGAQPAEIQTAITAALGDGAIVVSRERLREALAESFFHGCSRGNVMPLGDQVANWTEQALERLTAPEVEG